MAPRQGHEHAMRAGLQHVPLPSAVYAGMQCACADCQLRHARRAWGRPAGERLRRDLEENARLDEDVRRAWLHVDRYGLQVGPLGEEAR